MRSDHRTLVIGAVTALSLGAARPAEAQLWDAVAGKARPHMIIGFDTSVTMGITSNCNSCHRDSPGVRTRLDDAKDDILRTLPLFERYFYYGGFQYRGCGVAHVVPPVIVPDRDDPDASFNAVQSMIQGVTHCGSRERSLPGGGVSASCLTPTNACSGDPAKLQQVIQGGVPGLTIPTPTTMTTAACVGGPSTGATLSLQQLVLDQFATFSWPRWTNFVSTNQVRTELCTPLQDGLDTIWGRLLTCYGGDATAAAAIWDLSTIRSPAHCSPGQIANNVCTNSVLQDTCMCNELMPGCVPQTLNISACNIPLDFRARQQVGVCAAYSPASFGTMFASDRDNVASPNNRCRENIALFFSDGYRGDSPMVPVESSVARARFYDSRVRDANNRPLSNMFLFHISDSFRGDAAAMASAFGNPMFDARDGNSMLSSFAQMTNRVYRGQYVSANTTADRFGTRLAVHSFEVPSGPGPTGEAYLGRPSRVAVYAIDPLTGARSAAPLYATDWATKAGQGPGLTLCAPSPTGGCAMSGAERNLFGQPVGAASTPFRNGVQRVQNAVTAPNENRARRWGYMLGGSSTQPVIVDRPSDPPSQGGRYFQQFVGRAGVGNRPRMLYVMSNTFLHGIHMGTFAPNLRPNLGALGPRPQYGYDDNPAGPAGRELFRYFPRSWLSSASLDATRAAPAFNDVVVQPMITGQLQVADLVVDRLDTQTQPDRKFATILAAAQGRTGRGMATLDVSDPNAPRLLREWLLPVGETASAEPTLVQWPTPPGQNPRPAVVMTSGADAPNRYLRVYNARDGQLITSAGPLPGAGTMATEPTCLDVTGAGSITHCYALSSAGTVYRIPVLASGAFDGPGVAMIQPAGVVGNGRVFLTRPIVFFGSEGAVNIAFGSGRSTDFSEGSDTGQNRFYKIVDSFNRSLNGAGPASVANVCFYNNQLQSGIIELGARRVVSPPVISKGVVAFTTYEPGASVCDAGGAALWALDFARCSSMLDSQGVGAAPAPVGLGQSAGIPGSPVILRGAEQILAQTSGAPAASVPAVGIRTRGDNRTIFRRLFWRPDIETD